MSYASTITQQDFVLWGLDGKFNIGDIIEDNVDEVVSSLEEGNRKEAEAKIANWNVRKIRFGMFLGYAWIAPIVASKTTIRSIALFAMIFSMILSGIIGMIVRGIVDFIHDPVEAVLRFVLRIAVLTAILFYATVGIYAAVLLPLLIASLIISFLLMMMGTMWAMYKGFSAQFAA